MALNFITALLLFAATVVMGYTLLHILLGRRLKRRKETVRGPSAAESRERREVQDTEERSYCHPAINDAMGFEFITVVRPDVTPENPTQSPSWESSTGVGTQTLTQPAAAAVSVDDLYSLGDDGDDGGFIYGQDDGQRWPDEDDFFDIPDESDFDNGRIADVLSNPEVTAAMDSLVERHRNGPDWFGDFCEKHGDEIGAPMRVFDIPDEDSEMSDSQRDALQMEKGIGQDGFTVEDLEKAIQEEKE